MTPLQQFIHLLREAHAASEAVDAFDLHSNVPEEVETWRKLLAAQDAAFAALVLHAKAHGNDIIARAFDATSDRQGESQ